MSAIFSKNENSEVFLFDGNEKIGKKIYISGKGRCNITNSKEIYEFFDEINRNKNTPHKMRRISYIKFFKRLETYFA